MVVLSYAKSVELSVAVTTLLAFTIKHCSKGKGKGSLYNRPLRPRG